VSDQLKDGIKYDENKERFDLIPPQPLLELAKVYTIGAKKYEPRNMEKGMAWGRVFGAIMRHLWKFWRGEDYDEETGLHHVAQAAWGCFTLLDYTKTHPEFDDRVKLIDVKPRPIANDVFDFGIIERLYKEKTVFVFGREVVYVTGYQKNPCKIFLSNDKEISLKEFLENYRK